MKAIKTLLKNKSVRNHDGVILYLEGIALSTKKNPKIRDGIYSLEEVESMEPYTSPEEQRIEALEATVDRLTKELQKYIKEGEKGASSAHRRKHLTKGEVREVELIFEKKPNIPGADVSRGTGLSQPVISRIKAGTHSNSSEGYKALILKQNLGEA